MKCQLGDVVSFGSGLLKKNTLSYRGMVNDKVFSITTFLGSNVNLFLPTDIDTFLLPHTSMTIKFTRITPTEIEFEVTE